MDLGTISLIVSTFFDVLIFLVVLFKKGKSKSLTLDEIKSNAEEIYQKRIVKLCKKYGISLPEVTSDDKE